MMIDGAEIKERMIENVAHATAPIPSALEKKEMGEAMNIEQIEDMA